MTKARDLANLLGGGTSGVATFGGTAAIRVPNGTTAQRPTPALGMVRYNTTLGVNEIYDANGWVSIASPPTVSSVSPVSYNGEAGTVFTIDGANFDGGAIVRFVTSGGLEYTAATTTRVSSSRLTATTPQDFTVADEPLSIKVSSSTGLSGVLEQAVDCGGVPAWSTSAGSLGSVNRYSSFSASLSAVDPEGESVSYSLASGALLNGLSLNSSTGQISGAYDTAVKDGSSTTASFTVRATDNAGNTADRSFSLVGNNVLATTAFSSTGSTQTFTVPTGVTSISAYVWGAGGGSNGGGGGFSKANISVTPGELLTLVVGGAGTAAGGGGYSGIFSGAVSQANALLISGGGGGGRGGSDQGGGGGGANQGGSLGTCGPSVHCPRRGQPGSTSGGGQNGSADYSNTAQNGSALQGGDGNNPGGTRAFGGGGAAGINDSNPGSGGGGGYFGGGGSDANASSGGGSGFARAGRVTILTATQGPVGPGTAAGSGEAYYVAGVAQGGGSGAGRIVIGY